jgi:uncharacterized protein (DUF2141 family)
MKTHILSLMCLIAVPALAEGGTPDKQIVVELSLRSDTGVVHCTLWKSPEGFPKEYKKAAARVDAQGIKDKRARCVFTGVEAGTWAISVFHDEDGNGELKTNFVGVPQEPLGFSNNAKATFGPPKFDDAKFSYDGKALVLTIVPS